jgi:predicted O-methyltransferase YrrM
MHAIGSDMAQGVVAKLQLSGRENLIDVGGGSGVYTIALLKAAPKIRATIFDLPSVIEIARKTIAAESLTDRVTFVGGDFYEDTLPRGYDLALLSAIIHQNSPEQNVVLYEKVLDALVPGGTLIIRDHVMSEDHTQPAAGAFFAINMLVNTLGGGTYSFREIKRDLEAAGFTDVKLLSQGAMDSLVAAGKSA